MAHTQCLIIGSGPAGYTAAIYLVRSAIDCLLIEGLQVGGQLTQTTTIENYPGFPEGIDGFQLMDNMRQQAVNLGAKMKSGLVAGIDMSQRPFVVTLDGGEQLTADTIIVATGATAKYLGLPDETKYVGQGVSACATCDGFFYRKKVVAVVGGGDTACEEADYLSHLANKVYLIVRKDYLRASEAMQLRVQENDKIEIRESEPYSYCQFVVGRDHTAFGRARHPFMTGSSGWAYYAATQYLLGVRPDFDALRIDPCVPADWKEFTVTRIWRGARYEITVLNPEGVEKGVRSIRVDGQEVCMWIFRTCSVILRRMKMIRIPMILL